MIQAGAVCGALIIYSAVSGLGTTGYAAAQEETPSALTGETAEETKQRVTTGRFLDLLKKHPRQGTALDKVYGYHVSRGSLDAFAASLEQEAKEKNEGHLWMVLGMVQMQRGQDALAASALQTAEELLPQEPLASFYLGKTLVLLGEVDEAANSLRRAIERKPAKADLLLIFQNLGRILQRTGRMQEALDVWKQLESLFPADDQVREQIAGILAEEGAPQAALDRYTALANATKDRNRKVEFTIRAAQLKSQLGKTSEALHDFEIQLAAVNPESWLYRDIRRRIEEIFRATNDIDGLVTYYTKWVDQHTDDVDAMMRTARLLSAQKRLPEAEKWFRNAIAKAPTQVEPRLALVEALAIDSRFDQASAEMEKLVEMHLDNPDLLVRWGELVFSDVKRPEEQRRQQAGDIWRRLLQKRGDDPVTIARVADLLRGSGAAEAAIEQYRAAIERAPNEPQYREYLGEYLHQLNRKDEALTTWRDLASEARETRDNLVRLSEVLSTFHYDNEALDTLAKACTLKPTFGQRTRYAELLREAKRYDDALQQLELAEPLAEDPELREVVIDERIKNYQASGQLEVHITQAEEAVAGNQKSDAAQWRLLALLRDADRQFQPACDAIDTATKLAPNDVAIWETAAQLQERTGRLGEAIASYRKLVALDRRFLSNYLMQIASLEIRVGNVDAALKAGEELLTSAPGNSEHYRFFADLCFRTGHSDRALDSLRRNVRSNPNDQEALLYLAKMLAEDFHTDEAIELYWRGFEIAKDIEEKSSVVAGLVELYLRINRFDSLTERLELVAREQNKPRDGILWVAAAHQAADDLGMAKRLLEQLAREDSRDTKLLQQLVSLSRAEFDYESAAEYQKRLVAIAPTPEAEYLLANLMLDLGAMDEAEALWIKLSQRSDDSQSLHASITTLLNKEQYQTAAILLEKALGQNPNDWELAIPGMVTFVKLKRNDDARRVAERILAMQIDPAQPTKAVKEAIKKQSAHRASQPFQYDPYANLGNHDRVIQLAIQFKQFLMANESQSTTSYSSSSRIGQGLAIALCFQDAQVLARCTLLATKDEKFDLAGFTKQQVEQALATRDLDELWLALFYLAWEDPQVNSIQHANPSFETCLQTLVELNDSWAAKILLTKVISQRQQRNSDQVGTIKPMTSDEIQRCKQLNELASRVDTGDFNYYSLWFATELAFAGDLDESNRLIDQAIAKSKGGPNANYAALQAVSMLVSDRYNRTAPSECIDKALQLFRASISTFPLSPANSGTYYGQQFGLLANQLVKLERFDECLQIIDDVLRWQAQKSAELRPAQRERMQTSRVPLSYGKLVAGRHVTVSIDFPPISGYLGPEAIVMLHTVYETCAADDAKLATLQKALFERATMVIDDPYLRFARLLAATGLAYWSGQVNSAQEMLLQAETLQIEPQLVRLARARLLYELTKNREALDVIETLRPTNQQMMVDRELTILQLLLQLGDLERAKESSQKLFALRLDPDTEFKLADLMQQLGMTELSKRTMDRIRRRAGGKQDTLVQLMNRYAQANDNVAAAEIARQIIRRTSPRGAQRYYTSENQQHETAVRVLAQVDMLDPLIQQYEGRVKRSPKSTKLVDKLASFYEAAGRREDAQKLRIASVAELPDDPRALYAAGQQLAGLRKYSEAADKYIAAVTKSPEMLDQRYYEMQSTFKEAKAWDRLSDALIGTGIKKLGRSYQFSQICSELERAKEFGALNRLLFAMLSELNWSELHFSGFSSGRSEYKPDKNVLAIVREKLTPPDAEIESFSNQNFFMMSRSSNGKTYGFINLLAEIIAADPELLDQVISAMQARMEKNQEELFPRVLLCFVMIRANLFENLDQAVQPLLDKKTKSPPEQTAIWGLASTLMHEQQKPLEACKLLEAVDLEALEANTNSEFEYTATALLAYCYERAKRPVDAHRILSQQLRTLTIDERQSQSNPGYGEYRYINSLCSLSDRLLKMNYIAEAFIAYHKAFADKELLNRATRWGGNLENRKDELEKKIAKARNPETLLGIIRSTIEARKTTKDPAELAAVFLTEPQIERTSLIDNQVTMALQQFMGDLGEQDPLRQSITKWLHDTPLPDDRNHLTLKMLVTRLLISCAVSDDDQVAASAKAISEWVNTHEPTQSVADMATDPAAGPESTEPRANSTQKSVKSLPDELLLSLAASKIPSDVLPSAEVVAMLDRAIIAAQNVNDQALVSTLECQIAARLSAREPDRARAIYQKTLDELLPLDSGPNAAEPQKESK